MILVVLGHAIQHTLGEACEVNHLWNIIYSFHMPAFMAVSGYLMYRPQAKRGALLRRFRQLMVPFLVWSFIQFVLNPPYQIKELADYLLRPDSSFWFLWVLFWIVALFYVGDSLANRMRVKQEVIIGVICIALVAVMVFCNVRVLGIQFISYYFLFYAMGYYLHKYAGLVSSNKFFLLFLTLVWAVMAWFWSMHSAPVFLLGFGIPPSLVNYAYRFLTALVAVYVILCTAPKLLNYREGYDGFLLFLGVWSLGIYVVHLLILPYICPFFGRYLNPVPLTIVSFVLSLIGSMAVVYLLSLNEITAKYMLGKIDRSKSVMS